MLKHFIFICAILLNLCFTAQAQYSFREGFIKEEYMDMLAIAERQIDTPFTNRKIPFQKNYELIYRSPLVGLENRWDLWFSSDSTAVISLRATTRSTNSWLSNFYAAMVPATGSIEISESMRFDYSLAKNNEAAIHVGWLLALAHMANDIVMHMEALNKVGVRNFIITGHSQGGAIAFLLTAYLNQLQKKIEIPLDVQFKTYCSAAPKPGNLFFAYEFERNNMNRAFNIINPKDWVPETPVSIQTVNDFNVLSPFRKADQLLGKLKFPEKMAAKYAFRKLDKPTRKAQRRYERYLGKVVSKFVKDQLPDYKAPKYYCSNNYVRTGTSIILPVNEAYEQWYPDTGENIFLHHSLSAYYYLSRFLP
ncbi:MAG TPA: lipase family protein [Bacteroidia bacterium]|nr:lipase family protein [Bacteroidia bacterium]